MHAASRTSTIRRSPGGCRFMNGLLRTGIGGRPRSLSTLIEPPRPVAAKPSAFQRVAHLFVFAVGLVPRPRLHPPSVRCRPLPEAPPCCRCAGPCPTARRAGHESGRRAQGNHPQDGDRRRSCTTRMQRVRRSRGDGCRGRTGRGILASQGVPRRAARGLPGPAYAGSAGSGDRTARAFVSALCATWLPSGDCHSCCGRGRFSHWRCPDGAFRAAAVVCAGGRRRS
jgi:hypothetical protein